MSAAGLPTEAGLTQRQFEDGLESVLGMSYMVEVVEIKTRKVVKTLGPMSERKADRVERGMLRSMDTENYFVQTVQVMNDPENTDYLDTQTMTEDDES